MKDLLKDHPLDLLKHHPLGGWDKVTDKMPKPDEAVERPTDDQALPGQRKRSGGRVVGATEDGGCARQ